MFLKAYNFEFFDNIMQIFKPHLVKIKILNINSTSILGPKSFQIW